MSALAIKLKLEEFRDFEEILNLVKDFEKGILPRPQWTHRAHLTVACWYLMCSADKEAIPRIREGIKQYNASQGIVTTKESGYHETMTLFWSKMVRSYLAKATLDCSIVHLVNHLVACYSDSKIPFEYYSRDRLLSLEARTYWVEPDLKPLP
jgi:hypothetical protein